LKKLLKIALTLFITTIIVLGFAMPLNPVGNWYQQFMPNLNNEPIKDIIFLDRLTGFAVTGDGLPNDSNYILKTTNGGDNWVIKYRAYRDFYRIQFINQNTGFACGGFNSIGQGLFKTTNGGENWFNINAPGSIYFEDMSVLNEDTMWLVQSSGGDGGVFRTTDSGASWQQQLNLGSQNPIEVYFFNASTGYIAKNTGSSYVRKTTDGGTSWTVNVNGEGFTDMYFFDALIGYRAYGLMKKTTNGGLNWVNQPIPQGGNILVSQIVEFVNIGTDTLIGVGSTIITGSGNRGIICRSTNGGSSWTFQVPDSTINIFQYQNIAFTSRLQGWAYTGVTGVHTSNGGDPIWFTPITQISSEVPIIFSLYQNYPNPFNPTTNIKYQIVKNNSDVKISVFDITGKHIIDLVNRKQSAGTYEVDFSGYGLSSGVYFYSLIADGLFVETKKMVLIK